MKILTIILLFSSVISFGQPPYHVNINVWRVSTPVCADDSIKVDFKISNPTYTNNSVYFVLKKGGSAVNVVAWQNNSNILYNLPKETWPALAPGDSCYYIWLKVPKILGGGLCEVLTPELVPTTTNTFMVNPIPKANILERKVICKGGSFTFNPTGATSYTYSGGQIVSPLVTTTYTITSKLGTCVTTDTVLLTVQDCTELKENYQDEQIKIYFDLQGNKIEKIFNQLIIEQSRNTRKKVFFIN